MGHPGEGGQSESMPHCNPRMYGIQFCDAVQTYRLFVLLVVYLPKGVHWQLLRVVLGAPFSL